MISAGLCENIRCEPCVTRRIEELENALMLGQAHIATLQDVFKDNGGHTSRGAELCRRRYVENATLLNLHGAIKCDVDGS